MQRGRCWFELPGDGDARPAFVVEAVAAAGHPVVRVDPAEMRDRRRFHTFDGVGDGVEFLACEKPAKRGRGVVQN